MTANEHADLKGQILAWVVGDSDFHSCLANKAADARADYVRRGRRHADLSDDVLIAAWTRSFKDWVAHLLSPDICAVHRDLEAEIECRGLEAPYDDADVRAAMRELESIGDEAADAVARNPVLAERVTGELAEEIAVYQRGRARSQ